MSRWLKILLLLLAVAGLALFSIPWWLGAALRPALRPRGITFARYERVGYAQFQLHEVQFRSANLEFTADKVESDTPLAWLARRLRGAEPTLVVEGWRAQRMPVPVVAANQTAEKQITGLPGLWAAVQRLGPRAGYWLPRVRLSAGELKGFGPEIAIARADWQNSTLSVEGLRVADQVLAFVVAPAADGTVVLTAHSAGNEARLRLVWSGAEIKGEAALWEQPLQLAARFPADGWLPAEASAVAENWRLPAGRVKLGTPYVTVRADARVTWQDGAFAASLRANAEPKADTKAPPFEANATAHGNLRELTLTALHVDAPFATAKLTAPVTFSLDHPQTAGPARLVVQADLSKVPWIEAHGKAQGTVTVAGNNAAARQDFELEFTDVAVKNFTLPMAKARGVLQWPQLELAELNVQLDKATSLKAHGAVNCQTRELAGVAVEAKAGPAWFARWLPAGVTWGTAEITATAEGPLDALRHQGSLKLVRAEWPPLHPLAVDASWQGGKTKLEILSARATAGSSTIELAGTLDPHGLSLARLQFAPGGQAGWQLATPARLSWSPLWQINGLDLQAASSNQGPAASAAGSQPAEADSAVGPQRAEAVSGQAGSTKVVPYTSQPANDARVIGSASHLMFKGSGGPNGFIDLSANQFDSAWLQDWVTISGPAWQVLALRATGHVVDQVFVFETELTAQIAMAPRPAQVRLVASGDAHGVQVKDFKVMEEERVLTQATARVPVTLAMAPKPHLSLDDAAPIELAAATDPDSPLWATLAAATGLELTRPEAKINLKGTVRQPLGELQVKVAQLRAATGRFKFPLPEFADVTLALQFARAEVNLTAFSAKIEGQEVQASGHLPMDDGGWLQLWRQPAAFDWSRAAAHLDIPDADLAPFARRAPSLKVAQGRLRVRAELAPGKKFSGELHLTDAASRLLPPLGTFQDINADLVLAGHTITVRSMGAKLGGEPVTLAGSVTLVPDGAPRLALSLKGQNLPLVRNTRLLLRSDLDLQANTDGAGVTRLGGVITVRDCLLLANLRLSSLRPSGPRGVTRQPPYFAVKTEPFGHWALAVAVRAPKTVRVRTTVYNGTASAQVQIGGTLGEPRAVGELTVDEGQVLFPFATFKVQSGSVRLHEADPFHAVVSLHAAAQRRDYQLRLDVTGQLPSPIITLSSSPSLDADQVLLMVMTGRAPDEATAAGSSPQRYALLGVYLSRGLFQDLGFSGEDRLEINTGMQVSQQGRETYEFEYKLKDRWSVTGEYDEYDEFNAGLKWRVYTQESKADEKK